MEHKIVTSRSVYDLNKSIEGLIKEGWKPVGSHQAVTVHQQPQYRGNQLGQVLYTTEYSQTMQKS